MWQCFWTGVRFPSPPPSARQILRWVLQKKLSAGQRGSYPKRKPRQRFAGVSVIYKQKPPRFPEAVNLVPILMLYPQFFFQRLLQHVGKVYAFTLHQIWTYSNSLDKKQSFPGPGQRLQQLAH